MARRENEPGGLIAVEAGEEHCRMNMAGGVGRRSIVAMIAGGYLALGASATRATSGPDRLRIRFGLTPVFLSNDLEVLDELQTYLSDATGYDVELVTQRTYQEVTALLVSGSLDAAWICGYPYQKFHDDLTLVATPLWRGRPLYQSYLIVGAGRGAGGIEDCRGDIHAFSDPDSNSGYLVTRAYLAERGESEETFFRKFFFTYGHRNVIRAVASGLATSGSVDGYVWEVMREIEPELVAQTKVITRSEWHGFPPIAAPSHPQNAGVQQAVRKALLDMHQDVTGNRVLKRLRLDGFVDAPDATFDSIAENMKLVRRLG
jgi:phosphonate transport system substrate-binding protein